MSGIKAVLFDLDGVLVDACEWHYIALNKALFEVCGFKISEEDHKVKYNGLPTKVKLNMLGVKNSDFDKVWNLKQQYTIESIKKFGKEEKSKIELLKFLKEKKIFLGCVTNSIKHTASLMLSVTGQLPYFDLIITNEDVSEPKPSPECYNKLIKHIREGAGFVLIVEDSEKGIRSASLSEANLIWKVKNAQEVTKENFLEIFGGFYSENTHTNGR